MDVPASLLFAESWCPSQGRRGSWLHRIMQSLGRGAPSDDKTSGSFEFSLIEGSKNLRILHLDFPPHGSSFAKKRSWLKERVRRIAKAAALARQGPHWSKDIIVMARESLKTNCPLQIGFESSPKRTAMKLYLSAMGTPPKKFRSLLGAARTLLDDEPCAAGVDSLGLTVHDDGLREWKIYTYYPAPMLPEMLRRIHARASPPRTRTHPWTAYNSLIKRLPLKHWGAMYRIHGALPAAHARVRSIKFWARLERPISPESLTKHPPEMLGMLRSISQARARISYLTWEQGHYGVYFR